MCSDVATLKSQEKKFLSKKINNSGLYSVLTNFVFFVFFFFDRMASGTGHMQTRAVLSRSIRKRFDKHADGHIRGEVFVHLLPHEPGGKRRLQASRGHHMDNIAHDNHAVGYILRSATDGGGQRQSG